MRLNWNDRQSPTDFDNSVPREPDYSFDYQRCSEPGKPSWPEKHGKDRFGPALISKAWKAGLVVVAEIEGFPYHLAVSQAKWIGPVLVVVTLEGNKIPDRLYTRKSMKGFDSSGLLVNPELLEEG